LPHLLIWKYNSFQSKFFNPCIALTHHYPESSERCAHISSITFAHHKGGTGKTTSCLNIGGFLQKSGERVLLVDCDPQANATSGLGIDPVSRTVNMYDVFMGVFEGFPDVSLEETIIPTPSGIDLAPSSLDLVGVEPFLYNIDDRAGILRELLAPVAGRYDHVLIDTPPSMGQFVINGLVAADKTIVTLDSGIFALKGIAPGRRRRGSASMRWQKRFASFSGWCIPFRMTGGFTKPSSGACQSRIMHRTARLPVSTGRSQIWSGRGEEPRVD
jgi:hypothetical protein